MPAMPSKPSTDCLSTAQRAAVSDERNSIVLTRYLRDIRAVPLLSRAQERALGQQLQENRSQWRRLLLDHLLHVPLLLAWWPRLRRGTLPLTALCRPGTLPAPGARQAVLAALRCLASELQRAVLQPAHQGQSVPALRATMHALLHDWDWQPAFVQQAWRRFDVAMTMATTAQRPRRAEHYAMTLGYSLTELSALWRDLSRLSLLIEQAKHEMVNRNLRLVVSVAYKFRYTGIPLSDLIQEGTIGLMRAVDGFDYQRNLKFSTYAIWWIRQAIHRARAAHTLVRLPEYLYDDVQQVHRAHDTFVTAHGRSPTAQDIAQQLHMPLARAQWGLTYTPETLSLDSPIPGQERLLRDVLPDTRTPGSDVLLEQRDWQRQMQHALVCLTPREAEVICRRFGLDGWPGATLGQISQDLGISRERVRQIVATALAKLKRQLASGHDAQAGTCHAHPSAPAALSTLR